MDKSLLVQFEPLQKTNNPERCLPKKDKKLAQLNNWRPISLLNIDYKISTKGIDFEVRDHKNEKPHLKGYVAYL